MGRRTRESYQIGLSVSSYHEHDLPLITHELTRILNEAIQAGLPSDGVTILLLDDGAQEVADQIVTPSDVLHVHRLDKEERRLAVEARHEIPVNAIVRFNSATAYPLVGELDVWIASRRKDTRLKAPPLTEDEAAELLDF